MIYGDAFKPKTDDIREAPSRVLIELLLNAGTTIKAYDLKALEEAKHNLWKKEVITFYD